MPSPTHLHDSLLEEPAKEGGGEEVHSTTEKLRI
jgi:hypothetical protein